MHLKNDQSYFWLLLKLLCKKKARRIFNFSNYVKHQSLITKSTQHKVSQTTFVNFSHTTQAKSLSFQKQRQKYTEIKECFKEKKKEKEKDEIEYDWLINPPLCLI